MTLEQEKDSILDLIDAINENIQLVEASLPIAIARKDWGLLAQHANTLWSLTSELTDLMLRLGTVNRWISQGYKYEHEA